MDLNSIIDKVNGNVVSINKNENRNFSFAFASDLMSDVLTIPAGSDQTILITGLCTPQTIRTANVADIHTVIIARNKKATEEMIKLANEYNICIIESPHSIFRCCIAVHEIGLKPLY